MFVDARTLEPDHEIQADLCIAGAGAAGITLARALRGSGLSIAVLESGGFARDASAQSLYQGQMSGIDTWQLDRLRQRIFGGSTDHWGGWCMPLSPEDFAQRSWIPASGWPIGFADLVPYYRRAQRLAQLGGFDYDAAQLAAREQLPVLAGTGRLDVTMFQFSPPTRFGARYRDDLDEAEEVTVYLGANLTEIRLTPGLDRVDRLGCQVLLGDRIRAVADRYVLALGGLENPRLLLASRAQLADGVANSSGLVGRNFMEHVHYYRSVALTAGADLDWRFYQRHPASIPDDGDDREVEVQGMIALTPEVRAAEGLPDFSAQLLERPPDTATGEVGLEVADVLSRRRGADRAVLGLTCRVEQTPDPDSRVTLTSELDALGMPRIDLHWTERQADRRALRRSMEIVGAELAASGIGRLYAPSTDGAFDFYPQPGGHHMGTTRMSADPADGVVDADGRCHDLDNLYIAGSSVFATAGRANPTLTVIALAERLADHLVAT